eukprot:UN05559
MNVWRNGAIIKIVRLSIILKVVNLAKNDAIQFGKRIL